MDINEYRRKIEQSVAKVQTRQAKASPRSRTDNARRAVSDKKRPTTTRAEALGRVMRAEGPDAIPTTALERLSDRKESPAVRLAAIKLLQQKQFFSTAAGEWRPAFVEALRTAVREPKLRAAALEVLSLFKDRPTQELLIQGVRNPKKALVPVQEALRLLSTDIHADVIDIAKDQTSTKQARKNKAAFTQAVRILAADPGSIGTLEDVLANDAYSLDARRVAATAISHLEPDAVQRVLQTGRGRSLQRSGKTGAKAAKPKGALARHLRTLQRIRE